MKKVSLLIPCYNEKANIQPLYESLTRLFTACPQFRWEVLFVDDGSQDASIERIRDLRSRDGRICYIRLSRNFGKENALLAGFDHVTGDCTIIMDADRQHPVSAIPQMLDCWSQGFDDVYARRGDRGSESWLRRKSTLLYYKILKRLAKTDILPNVGDFRLLDRKCIQSLRQLRETQRYTKGLYCWIGFRKKEIIIEQQARTAGRSSFTYRRLFNLAIEGITSYSTAPLRISTLMGLVVSMVAFVYMCYVLIKTLIVGEAVQGFPTLIIVILFMGGIQLLSLGIIGEYLARIFHETKHRPVYLIDEKEGV